jgi:hypothetical protein
LFINEQFLEHIKNPDMVICIKYQISHIRYFDYQVQTSTDIFVFDILYTFILIINKALSIIYQKCLKYCCIVIIVVIDIYNIILISKYNTTT